MDLDLPDHLSADQLGLLVDLAERNLAEHGDGLLGLVLTGSAGRGLATERSDLDLYVVLTDDAATGRRTERSRDVDEIPVRMSELESPASFGTEDWWARWSFAWAPVLLDRADGAVAAATLRQATLEPDEADAVLLDHDRLDGWLNFAYRALKSDRDGRDLERRLDAAESVPWLLDTVFAMAGRVRPYNKYLAWELREHPLPEWPAGVLLPLVERTLEGNPGAVRETYARLVRACAAYDFRRGHRRTQGMVEGWGDELAIFDV